MFERLVDDTIIFGKASLENIGTIKAILRNFEQLSGLKINYAKSSLVTVNVEQEEAELMALKLNCKLGRLPISYLGIPVGSNPRRVETWKPVIDAFYKRLSRWENKNLSFGGRLVLARAVLTALPTYFFSFFIAPSKVLKTLTSIQRNFVWGGSKADERRIAWVKWERVCRPKGEGGLGIRELGAFNKALVGKWGWKLIQDPKSLWVKVLTSKYLPREQGPVAGGTGFVEVGNRCSIWWKDLIIRVMKEDWFMGNVKRVVGEGDRCRFWEDVWVGQRALRDSFNRLFNLTEDKGCWIRDKGWWEGDTWRWKWRWRRDLLHREAVWLQELEQILSRQKLTKGKSDGWRWVKNK